ncbi:hypothetical protein Tco_1351039, partial [Tanacetum coccineum]
MPKKNITSSPPSPPRRRFDRDVAKGKDEHKCAFRRICVGRKPTRSRAATLAGGIKTQLTTSFAKDLATDKAVSVTSMIIFILNLKVGPLFLTI